MKNVVKPRKVPMKNAGGSMWKRSLLFALALLLPLFCVGSCSAQEVTYLMTERELLTLSNNYQRLKVLTLNNQNELNELNNQLVLSKEELTKVKSELAESKATNQKLSESLTKANKYLNEYAKEEHKRQSRIKRQRTFYSIAAGGLIVALAKKASK